MGVNTYAGLYEGNELYGYCVVIVWLLCGADREFQRLFDKHVLKFLQRYE